MTVLRTEETLLLSLWTDWNTWFPRLGDREATKAREPAGRCSSWIRTCGSERARQREERARERARQRVDSRRVEARGQRPLIVLAPPNAFYRRRARDWDPGFRTTSELSTVMHAGAVSPSSFASHPFPLSLSFSPSLSLFDMAKLAVFRVFGPASLFDLLWVHHRL